MAIAFLLFVIGSTSGLAAAQSPTSACTKPGFNSGPWLEDFAQVTAEMAGHYANLEYAVHERHMDLPLLRQQTEKKLAQSCSEEEGRRALQSFMDSFGDGHLEVNWPAAPVGSMASNSGELLPLCQRLGYKNQLKPGIDFSPLPQFTNVEGEGVDWFPGGILRLTDTVKLGVIRIAIFSEHAFPGVCEQTILQLRLADSAKCDAQCEDKIEREAGNLLTAALVRRETRLRAAGATAILVDITHNGGGSNWVEAAVRALSHVPLHESHLGFIKHEHWTKQLQEQLDDVEKDLKNRVGPKDVLEEAANRLRAGIARSKDLCERSHVWIDGELPCSLQVADVLFVSGVLDYAPPGSFPSLESRTTLFHPLRYSYPESPDKLPLYVLIDSETWSAAEYFAAILQDNNAAVIFGEVTGGAGCGYTNGGIPITLKNSHAVVKMPDCVRLRKDGTNEVSGITPNVWVPWSAHDNSYIRAQKLFQSLRTWFALESKEASHEAH